MQVSFAKTPEGPVIETTTKVAGEPAQVENIPVDSIPATPGTQSETHAVATVPAEALPVASQAQSPIAFDDENIGFDDVILPRLNIVQKVGELSNVFVPGEIVLNQQTPIYTPPVIQDGTIVKKGTEPLSITVLGFKKKQFVEKVIGGAQGALCNTEAELAQLGGTLDYKEHGAKVAAQIPSKLFQRLATALVLVQRPLQFAESDADHLLFPYECEGKYYALTLWSMKGTAYTNAAKTIFTARKIGHLRSGGYASKCWTLGTKLNQYETNFAYVPVLKASTSNSPAFLEFVKDVLGCGK